MDNKLSELKAAAAKYSLTLDAHRENPKDRDAVDAWDTATEEFSRVVNNDEMSIIIALLAELEAKDKRIIGLERHVKDIEATLIAATDEVADLTKERDEARAKLATPAAPEKCPCCNRRYTLESYAHGECAICGEAFDAAHALRSMGFKVEGDE
ncbi:hypothetical protein ACTVNX_24060 [Serratia nevei]|uniref:hypothetical protein n=1 Tax=Serratia nevei TaxID=2703794 RepID=UPI0018D7C0D1|nr:hypothetical protein [Serratia marcescens]MBI6131552.1 hypothetical protein [Serratia marcescens]